MKNKIKKYLTEYDSIYYLIEDQEDPYPSLTNEVDFNKKELKEMKRIQKEWKELQRKLRKKYLEVEK